MVNPRTPNATATNTASNAATVRLVEQLLREETAICERYLAIIKKEQGAVTKLDSAVVTECAAQREECLAGLSALRERRVEALRTLTDSKKISTTEVLSRVCHGKEKQRMIALVDKLQATLARVESASRECKHVVDFSLGLVNGSLSILRSAAQDVTKGYTPYGTITESAGRQVRRRGGSLGEA